MKKLVTGKRFNLNSELLTCSLKSYLRLDDPPHPGGSALNTVRILKELGTDALFCGASGNDQLGLKLKTFLDINKISAR